VEAGSLIVRDNKSALSVGTPALASMPGDVMISSNNSAVSIDVASLSDGEVCAVIFQAVDNNCQSRLVCWLNTQNGAGSSDPIMNFLVFEDCLLPMMPWFKGFRQRNRPRWIWWVIRYQLRPMPTEDCIGGEKGAYLAQELATKAFSFHGQAAALAVVQQDATLAKFFSKYLILGPEVVIDLLLLVVNPAGEDEMEQLPGLKNEVHSGPVALKEDGLASGLELGLSTGRKPDPSAESQRNQHPQVPGFHLGFA